MPESVGLAREPIQSILHLQLLARLSVAKRCNSSNTDSTDTRIHIATHQVHLLNRTPISELPEIAGNIETRKEVKEMNPGSNKGLSGHEMAELQGSLHNENHDYADSSPHIKHDAIRESVERAIAEVVGEAIARRGSCAVLEIGAGHGTFTDSVLKAGGRATVTEMSQASADYLTKRYEKNKSVTVVVDPDGDEAFRLGQRFDIVLFVSVIHHIPDYLGLLDRLTTQVVDANGSILCFQDPLWYPRQSRVAASLSWISYFAWRVPRGDIKRGLGTRWRHLRGVRDDSISDSVEYHVVRDGVDDEAIESLLSPRFTQITKNKYFSTQSTLFQNLGQNRFPPNTFSLIARGRL